MPPLTTARIRTLLNPPGTPCVSVYLPTHRHYPANQQDPIRYRNLVDAVEQSLRAKYPGRDVRALLGRFRELAADHMFWNHTLDGLGVLGAADQFEVFKLPRAVPELGVVADSYHLKPLLRYIQSADRFHVLCLSRTEAKLFEGNRYGLDPVENSLPTFAEAVGEEYETATGRQRSKLDRGGREHGPHYSGHGGGKDEVDVDQQKFLRAIDRVMIEKFSKPSGLPLVAVGLDDNLGEFRKLTQNRLLVEETIHSDPGAFDANQLRAQAWKVMEPKYLARLARLTEDYRTALARGLASSDPAAIAPAALDGRVGLLLVDADKVVPGKIDRDARTVRTDKLDNPEVDDVLDDLAELVLNTGGEVVVVPSDRMPTDTGAAAVYRF
jgi:hypothetical protein